MGLKGLGGGHRPLTSLIEPLTTSSISISTMLIPGAFYHRLTSTGEETQLPR